jgi:hypothetical protein
MYRTKETIPAIPQPFNTDDRLRSSMKHGYSGLLFLNTVHISLSKMEGLNGKSVRDE